MIASGCDDGSFSVRDLRYLEVFYIYAQKHDFLFICLSYITQLNFMAVQLSCFLGFITSLPQLSWD
jgi:hypothetical protein